MLSSTPKITLGRPSMVLRIFMILTVQTAENSGRHPILEKTGQNIVLTVVLKYKGQKYLLKNSKNE